jgi:hypothetical protein
VRARPRKREEAPRDGCSSAGARRRFRKRHRDQVPTRCTTYRRRSRRKDAPRRASRGSSAPSPRCRAPSPPRSGGKGSMLATGSAGGTGRPRGTRNVRLRATPPNPRERRRELSPCPRSAGVRARGSGVRGPTSRAKPCGASASVGLTANRRATRRSFRSLPERLICPSIRTARSKGAAPHSLPWNCDGCHFVERSSR